MDNKIQMALDITFGLMRWHSENIIHGNWSVNKEIMYCLFNLTN